MLAKEIKKKLGIRALTKLVTLYFHVEKHFLSTKNINYPKEQCIFSMWHCHQMLVYGIEDKENCYTLISPSNDGEIIAKAAATMGVKSVRGSKDRRGTAASLELIDKIKNKSFAAIMVDGPTGPAFKVKSGIINIAKLSGIPIVPCVWYSPQITFLKFNTWDQFRAPLGPCKTVALYGEPIYIPSEITKEEVNEISENIRKKMFELQEDIEKNYNSYIKQ